jgi:hypothetical protein
MPHLRRKDWVRFALLVALVGAVLVVELMSGGLRDFYKERPLQAGVLTGLLLSIVAYFGFDAIRAELTQRRWAPLSRLALMWLASQTTILIDVALWLVTGQPPDNDARPDQATQDELIDIRARAGADAATKAPDLGQIKHDHYLRQLEILMRDPAWRAFARQQLDRWKWRNREGIATWAAAMLTTGESADVLNRLALLNEWISTVQESLRSPAPSPAKDPTSAWLEWHAEAVSLREDLVIASRGTLPPEWRDFRGALPQADRDALESRHGLQDSADGARTILRRPFKIAG